MKQFTNFMNLYCPNFQKRHKNLSMVMNVRKNIFKMSAPYSTSSRYKKYICMISNCVFCSHYKISIKNFYRICSFSNNFFSQASIKSSRRSCWCDFNKLSLSRKNCLCDKKIGDSPSWPSQNWQKNSSESSSIYVQTSTLSAETWSHFC